MKNLAIVVLAFVTLTSSALSAFVTNVIESMTTPQTVVAENSSVTSTTNSPGSIGGFRTVSFSSFGNDLGDPSSLQFSSFSQRMLLSTPDGPNTTFSILWGGADGTAGLGGTNFGGGLSIDLAASFLTFALRSTDQVSNFTWEFTDTDGKNALYSASFPVHSSSDPVLKFDIPLDSFANSGAVDWSAIDYIKFSGGGVPGLDMALPARFEVVGATVPEPSTWALLAAGLAVSLLAARRRFKHLTQN